MKHRRTLQGLLLGIAAVIVSALMMSVPSAQAQISSFSTTLEGGRGLTYIQSARTFGKGSVVFGLKGLSMEKRFLLPTPDGGNDNVMDLPSVLAVPITFGLTDEIDISASFYGLSDARGLNRPGDITMGYADPEMGVGSTHVGIKIRVPFSPHSPVQVAGKVGALFDTSIRQLDGLNYRWSRKGTDIEASLIETIEPVSFLSFHFEEGYVLSGTKYYDDQILGAAGIEIRLRPWWTVSCEVVNRTFLGKSPESIRRAGTDPNAYYSVNGVPAVGDPLYLKDNKNDFKNDYFAITPAMSFRLNRFMAFDCGATINIADQVSPAETIQAVVGITFATQIMAMIDSDRDGIRNNKDMEPMTPRGYPVDANGRAIDTDRDGVPDAIDRQSDTPLGAKTNDFGVGIDSDNDGIYDGLDMEPMTPRGCPVDSFGVAIDSDKDGVPDGFDKETNTPRGAVVDNEGRAIDEDKDGVPNGIDMEPRTPHGAKVDINGVGIDGDGDGVPDGIDVEANTPAGVLVDKTGRALVKKEANIVKEGMIRLNAIYYNGGSIDVPSDASTVIDEIGRIMIKYPNLKIQIEGHTDNTGDPTINMKLARDRARKVFEAIISRYPELSRDRFRVVGFGSDRPIASNATAEGRRTNRRVEFVIINQTTIKE